MCGVIFIALALTAYMAVFFTRRARADLETALNPLAEIVSGTVDLEEAQVSGQFISQLAFGRMANAEGGPVRVFQVDLVDPAGGEPWLYALIRPRREEIGWTEKIEPEGADLLARFPMLAQDRLPDSLMHEVNWAQIEYSAEGGYIRITRPMATRKDIPDGDAFTAQLEFAYVIAQENRNVIESSNA